MTKRRLGTDPVGPNVWESSSYAFPSELINGSEVFEGCMPALRSDHHGSALN